MVKVKKLFLFSLFIFSTFTFLFSPLRQVWAADQNVVTPIYIVRGREYWRQSKNLTEVTKIVSVVEESGLKSTWLIQFDALQDAQVVEKLKGLSEKHEIGIYLEVTRKQADKSTVYFDWNSGHWSAANKLFLSGYERDERQRLIDTVFAEFLQVFGHYPKSYGSWYQDGFTLEYIKEKYGLDTVLGLADQYSTDGYQSWGQYINQPYYVSKKSSLEPALNNQDNTGVVKVLWAPREPTMGYGKDKNFSTFSLQANDYHRNQGLSTSFFESLLKTSTLNIEGKLSQVVVGIEVSELEDEYFEEIVNQLEVLKNYQNQNLLSTYTLSQFGKLYKETYPDISPSILTQSEKEGVISYWYTSPFYRIGLFYENGQLEIRDLRFYHQNGYRDNDQIQPDKNENLTRIVPALIDDIVLSNKLIISETSLPEIKQFGSNVLIKHSTGEIELQADKVVFTGIEDFPIPHTKKDGEIILTSDFKTVGDIEKRRCSNEYGGYYEKPCWNKFLVALQSLIPDFRYSKLFGKRYLGIRTSPDTLFAIRFDDIKIDNFYFEYPLLENFISIREKAEQDIPWFGKQEEELNSAGPYHNAIRKHDEYGEENLIQATDHKKIFENSYYLVTDEK